MRQKIIYDVIHRNIELSDFESLLLRNSIVNRLHQILQNSVAYTVYPNMKASRFEHSLGVMDYSGLMYKYGIINSEITEDFLKNKTEWLENRLVEVKDKIFNSFRWGESDLMIPYKQILKNEYGINNKMTNIGSLLQNPKFIDSINDLIGDSFINRNLHHQNTKYKGVNILLYQVTRLFGLLHDIGHLPLSHLMEFSIDSLHERLEHKKDKSDIENDYFNRLTNLLKYDDKLHEVIGKNVTKYIFQHIHKQVSTNKKDSTELNLIKGIIVFIIQEIWVEVIKGEKGYFNSLYSIVSGTIDSDRLDFVQRDGLLSGIAKHSGNVDRIIEMYCLGKNPNPDKDTLDNYLFMPSIQSLDSLEELLHDRFRIYKYVVNHHAVLRSNYIMQKVIEEKLFKEISLLNLKKGKKKEEEEEGLIPLRLVEIIDLAIEILKEDIQIGNSDETVNKFIQLTDFWLLSILNREFIQSIKIEKSKRSLQEILLVEVYKSKRSFKSLWKRDYDFQFFIRDIGIHFVNRFIDDYESFNASNLNDFKKKVENLRRKKIKKQKFIEVLSNYVKLDNTIKKIEEQIDDSSFEKPYYMYAESIKQKNELDAFFISIGGEVISEIGLLDDSIISSVLRRIEKKFNDSEEHTHILLSRTIIKSGIKSCYLIDRNNQKNIRKLNSFSKKEKAINEEINSFIKFYAFYYDNGSMGLEEKIRKTLISYIILELLKK